MEQPGIVGTYLQRDLIFKYAIALHALALEKRATKTSGSTRRHKRTWSSHCNYVPRYELYLLRRFKAKLAANLGK